MLNMKFQKYTKMCVILVYISIIPITLHIIILFVVYSQFVVEPCEF